MTIDQKASVIYRAIQFAEKKHKSQTRKASGSPYIHHPIMVSYFVANFKQSKKLHQLIAAAILHDVIEDTSTKPEQITRLFGQTISSIVFELTDDEEQIKKIGKLAYQKQKWTGLSSYALYLKLCDRLANVSDSPTDKYKSDTKIIINNLKKKRNLSRSHQKVIKEILQVCS